MSGSDGLAVQAEAPGGAFEAGRLRYCRILSGLLGEWRCRAAMCQLPGSFVEINCMRSHLMMARDRRPCRWPILNNILCVGDRCPEEIPDLLFQLLDVLDLQRLFVPRPAPTRILCVEEELRQLVFPLGHGRARLEGRVRRRGLPSLAC